MNFFEFAASIVDSVLSWPVAVFVLLILFRDAIAAALPKVLSTLASRIRKAKVGEHSFEFGEEARAFQNAIKTNAEQLKDRPEEFAQFIDRLYQKMPGGPASAVGPLAGRAILWVDDNPKFNAFETELFTRFGARVTSALTTAEAMDAINSQDFDLIISDVKRTEDGQENYMAGYELQDKLEDLANKPPLIFYLREVSRVPNARRAKAAGAAGDARDLRDRVLALIGDQAA
jgi:CheY-like chemotaxis protein